MKELITNRENSIITTIVFSIVLLLLCSNSAIAEETKTSANASDQVSTQLSALMTEIKALRNEVQQLNLKFDQITKRRQRRKKIEVTKIPFDDKRRLGSEQATIGIVEFTDYQCPFCLRYAKNTFPQLKTDFIDKGLVQYQVKDFPLVFHKKAQQAAVAANCAGEQQSYWLMHDAIFASRNQFDHAFYLKTAEESELNMPLYKSCLADEKQIVKVKKDFDYGKKIGINGTPAFFVGKVSGKQLVDITVISGAANVERFIEFINSKM